MKGVPRRGRAGALLLGAGTLAVWLAGCEGEPGRPGVDGTAGAKGQDGKDATIPMGATPPIACDGMAAGRFYVNTTGGMPRLDYCDGKRWAPLREADRDCPAGYERDQTDPFFQDQRVLCKRGVDEVVKVGTGASAFWIDRYEASVWENVDGTGRQIGLMFHNEYPETFQKNGQYEKPLFALSKKLVSPSRSLTWFQAQATCNVSGKRLPTRNEWLEAARGTPDPGSNAGSQGQCVTQAPSTRNTGGGSICRSRWGTEDMIGNLWEWTDEWYAGLGNGDTSALAWPDSSYAGDGTWNIISKVNPADGTPPVQGLPAAAYRGGEFRSGTSAGIFAMSLNYAPSLWFPTIGFRCVVPR